MMPSNELFILLQEVAEENGWTILELSLTRKDDNYAEITSSNQEN